MYVMINYSILKKYKLRVSRVVNKTLKKLRAQMFTDQNKTFQRTFEIYFLAKVHEIWIFDY